MTSYWLPAPNEIDIVLPSLTFANALDFFSKVKPPFFESYQVVIVEDSLN